jgi:tetratricopeptide (TPR) repeat protein
MTTKILKYNPSFLTDQELVDAFVVRHAMLHLLLEVIRDNTGATSQHALLIGPRGSGKTTLLRRVTLAVRQTPELDAQWLPLPFGEESYEATSAGEFWLEAIRHLGGLTGDPTWAKAYDELLREPDEQRLGQRCLARLLDFADAAGKRLLLIVENLNLILGEQFSDKDAWSLRNTLMHERRLMLLGSATSRFDAIIKPNQALFELFRLFDLERLTQEECQQVWRRVTQQEISVGQARAVQILTGGNPRLLTILAIFGANRSFRSLLEDLSLLVDEHTDYFKSNFEMLPPTERKVFACLATLWEDSPASEVATAARMTASQASALLKRLESRGVVQATSLKSGKKRYQLSERLYNIYYLMRRGQDAGRVQAVARFMVQFYGPARVHEAVADIAKEACCLPEGQRRRHYWAIQYLCDAPFAREGLERIRGALPQEFLQLSDIPEELKRFVAARKPSGSEELEALNLGIGKAVVENRWKDAEIALRRTVQLDPHAARAWATLGHVLANQLAQPEEGADCLRKAVELDPEYARAWATLGRVLANQLAQPEEGADCLRKSVELGPKDAWAWATLGRVLANQFAQPEEGADCLRKAVELDPKSAWAWAELGTVLANQLAQLEEGADCLRKAVELEPKFAFAWEMLGLVLADRLAPPEESADCLRKAVELDPELAWVWAILGYILILDLNNRAEGLECLEKGAALDPRAPNQTYLADRIRSHNVSFADIEAILERTGRPASLLNTVACALMDAEEYERLDAIAAWARLAVEKSEGDPQCHGTLARALALRGDIPEALEQVGILLQHPEIVREYIQEPTDILTIAASLGHAQRALELLEASPCRDILEPLAAGLKQYLGLDVRAPQEVREIGEDIVKRIEQWTAWRRQRTTLLLLGAENS